MPSRPCWKKQEAFGLLLAENVSHQLFTRFVIPTVLKFGAIRLRNEDQANAMDQVVRSTIHSFHVSSLRIYDAKGSITYSLNKDEVGDQGNAGYMVTKTWETEDFSAEILARVSKTASLFRVNLDPGSMVLRAYYPLRAERSLTNIAKNPNHGHPGISAGHNGRLFGHAQLRTAGHRLFADHLAGPLLPGAHGASPGRTAQQSSAPGKGKNSSPSCSSREKLAGMGRMVAGVAHEIRNPLGIICSSSELILKKARKENSSHIRIMEALHEEAKRLSRTVTEFLDYARPKKPAMMPVDIRSTLEQVMVFMEPECEKLGVTIDSDFEGDMSTKGDKDLLYRAFYNLVANALQAMNGPGEISIRAARGEKGLHVTIVDTGPGFSPEHLDQVRDPFFTTKDTGTGLGLALVSTIFESHGVEMALSNAEEGGARVDVIFPA